jgi:hypothetical protein
MRAVVDAFMLEIPRAEIKPPTHFLRDDPLNQYVLTDAHFGKLAWGEETGSDYDLKIAEQMYLDSFSMAIRLSPEAATGLVQLMTKDAGFFGRWFTICRDYREEGWKLMTLQLGTVAL